MFSKWNFTTCTNSNKCEPKKLLETFYMNTFLYSNIQHISLYYKFHLLLTRSMSPYMVKAAPRAVASACRWGAALPMEKAPIRTAKNTWPSLKMQVYSEPQNSWTTLILNGRNIVENDFIYQTQLFFHIIRFYLRKYLHCFYLQHLLAGKNKYFYLANSCQESMPHLLLQWKYKNI